MERFVRFTAPVGKIDFAVKLLVFLLICGGFNHLRHVLTHGFPGHKSYWMNFSEAAFTALPMCAFALILIGHLNSLQKRLYIQATRDTLTQLPNRRWFLEKTPLVVKPQQALMIIDVDHFKQINDQFGHDVGDACLQDMAQHLSAQLDDTAFCARIGGEEFAVFLPNIDMSSALDIAQNISDGFLFEPSTGQSRRVTSSVGLAMSERIIPREDAMKLADKAVYIVKSNGRAGYHLIHDTMQGPEVAGAVALA